MNVLQNAKKNKMTLTFSHCITVFNYGKVAKTIIQKIEITSMRLLYDI